MSNKIRLLTRQIKELQLSGEYKNGNEDPYRLPARINLLSYLCGLSPCFNCKSGKDRSGQLDTATKELAISLEARGENLRLRTSDSLERKMLMRDLAFKGGGLEITRLNTSARGFKLTGVDGLAELYGNQAGNEAFRGLS